MIRGCALRPPARRDGFTILEVLVAMALLMILVVPLAWTTIYSAQGRSQARRLDDAVALAREDWGTVRLTPVAALADTSYERSMGGHSYLVTRAVRDTAAARAGALQGPPELGAKPPPRIGPAVRTCVSQTGTEDSPSQPDTLRCFDWRVPLVRVQP